MRPVIACLEPRNGYLSVCAPVVKKSFSKGLTPHRSGDDGAEALALEVLAYLAADKDLMEVFLGSTGYPVSALRSAPDDPELLAAVTDFLMQDDSWVLDFAAQTGHNPADIARCRRDLPGGDVPNWT